MKVFEAKERQGRYLRECLLGWSRAAGSSAAAGRGSEGRRGSPTVDNDETLCVVVGHGIEHLVNARDRNRLLHESIRS